MLFNHFSLTQRFVSPASREYFDTETTTFLSPNWQKKYSPAQSTAKYVFEQV